MAGSYSVAVSPSSINVRQGRTASFQVTLQASNGYSSPVSLSLAGLPSGSSYSFSTNPVTPTAAGVTVTLRIPTGNVARGTYPLTISGRGADGLTSQASASLTVR